MTDFGHAFTNMLYDRLEGGRFLKKLQGIPEYAQAQRSYYEAYEALAGTEGFTSGSPEQALLDCLNRLRDLEAQFIYRAGIQDGLSMTRPGFLVAGVA